MNVNNPPSKSGINKDFMSFIGVVFCLIIILTYIVVSIGINL